MSRKTVLICLFIIALCAAATYGVYHFHEEMMDMRQQRSALLLRINGLQRETDLLMLRKRAYAEAFLVLEELNIGSATSAGSGIDFYSEAQEAIRKGGSRIISNSPNNPANGRMTMGMSFTGDYYNVLRSLADIRALRNAVRVVSMTLAPSPPSGNVKIDVVLESPIY